MALREDPGLDLYGKQHRPAGSVSIRPAGEQRIRTDNHDIDHWLILIPDGTQDWDGWNEHCDVHAMVVHVVSDPEHSCPALPILCLSQQAIYSLIQAELWHHWAGTRLQGLSSCRECLARRRLGSSASDWSRRHENWMTFPSRSRGNSVTVNRRDLLMAGVGLAASAGSLWLPVQAISLACADSADDAANELERWVATSCHAKVLGQPRSVATVRSGFWPVPPSRVLILRPHPLAGPHNRWESQDRRPIAVFATSCGGEEGKETGKTSLTGIAGKAPGPQARTDHADYFRLSKLLRRAGATTRLGL